jgi:hypothetical protein
VGITFAVVPVINLNNVESFHKLRAQSDDPYCQFNQQQDKLLALVVAI